MQNIKLVFPEKKMKDDVLGFKQEFFDAGERTIYGSYKLDTNRYTYDELLEIPKSNLTTETANPKFGVSETYFAVNEDGVIVGIINFRHTLTAFYSNSGHVGYSVRPSYRKQGYATRMLSAILSNAYKAGLAEIKLVCEQSNIASIKTIINNGGKSIRTFEESGVLYNEYLIIL